MVDIDRLVVDSGHFRPSYALHAGSRFDVGSVCTDPHHHEAESNVRRRTDWVDFFSCVRSHRGLHVCLERGCVSACVTWRASFDRCSLRPLAVMKEDVMAIVRLTGA